MATIQQLIASRLEDMADQVKLLAEGGYIEEALLLREEGLALLKQNIVNYKDCMLAVN